MGSASEEKDVARVGEGPRELLDLPLEGERLLEGDGEVGERLEERVARLEAAETARLAGVVREEGEGDELRREGLRRGDPDLGARVGGQDAVDESRDGRPRDVHDADGRCARALRVGQGCDGVGGLARLRDPDDERSRRDEAPPVAELGRVVDLDRDARHLLEEELPDESRVPARPAGDDHDPVDSGEELRGDSHRVFAETPRLEGELVPHRLDDDRWLLGDLLGHEVGVAPLLGGDGVPRDAPRRPAPRRAVEAGHVDRRRGQRHEVAVLEEDEVPRVRQQRRGVGGDEVLPRPEAEDDRRPVLGDVEDVRLVGRQDDDGIHARHPRQDRPDDPGE